MSNISLGPIASSRRRNNSPPWSPADQFSSLIFWVDAKQAISGVDYDANTKALISWTDEATGNDLVPNGAAPLPDFLTSGTLAGFPAFRFSNNASAKLKNSDFITGQVGYPGPAILGLSLSVIIPATTLISFSQNPNGVTQSLDTTESLYPVLKNTFYPEQIFFNPIIGGGFIGPIFDVSNQIDFIFLCAFNNGVSASQRRLYVRALGSGSIPGYFGSFIDLNIGDLWWLGAAGGGSPIYYVNNNGNVSGSEIRMAENFLATDVISDLNSALDQSSSGMIKKWLGNLPDFVMCWGDSLTNGHDVLQSEAYPYQFSQLLSIGQYDVANTGVAGKTTADLISDLSNYTFLIRPGVSNTAIIWIGTNDNANGDSAATIYGNLTTLVSNTRAAGFSKIVVMPMIPRNWMGSSGSDVVRNSFNSLLESGLAGADKYIPIINNANFDVDSSYLNSNIYESDGIHLKTAGYEIVAQIVFDNWN